MPAPQSVSPLDRYSVPRGCLAKPIKTLLADAMAMLQAGNLAKAAELYRSVLAVEPNQFDALHMLGAVEAQLGRFDEGERLLTRAVAAAPGQPAAHLNRGPLPERRRPRAAERP